MEESTPVEPVLYAPIIPTILINGKIGIGTGFSTNIPMFNPLDICKNVLALIDKKKQSSMKPWYRGFNGKIEEISKKKYKSYGIYSNDEETITITELPIGTCTDEYKEFLDKLSFDPKNPKDSQIVESYKCVPHNTQVNITIKLRNGELQSLIKADKLVEKLKLESNINLTNMWLYDAEGHLKLYNSPQEVIKDYYDFRYKMYELRKKYYTKVLENKLGLLKYKKLFIEYYLEGRIVINKTKTEENVILQLEKLKFPKLSNKIDDDAIDASDDANNYDKSYNYLTDMKIFSLTKNKVEELEKELAKVETEYETYKNTTVENLWKQEISEFIEAYDKYLISVTDEPKKKRAKTK